MNNYGTLIAIGLAFLVVAASPGPANLANATIAMRYGRKHSLMFGAGLSVALSFWGILAATGLGAVLQASESIMIAFKICGAAYLLWLAWQSARSAVKIQARNVGDLPQDKWFLRGLILNLSNPKAVFAWMAALSVGLDPSDTMASVISATLLCVFIAFANNTFYSVVFSTGSMMSVYERSRRWIDGIVAGLFAVAGLGLLRSALTK